jgi:hypothetical protein
VTTKEIVQLLIDERDRLSKAIEVLQGTSTEPPRRRGRPAKSMQSTVISQPAARKGRKGMSPAARKAQSERMKKYWAERARQRGKGN